MDCRIGRVIMSAFTVSMALLALTTSGQAATVDFSVGMDPPLVKKFAMYNAGLPPFSNYQRDIDHIRSLRADHLRIDLGMGKLGSPETTGRDVVKGSATQPIYDFSGLDRLAHMLLERDVLPYYAWCYVPFPLQRNPGDSRTIRKDSAAFAAYRAFHRKFGEHYAARGSLAREGGPWVGYHEIYNEPDNPDFLENFDPFLEMYRAGSLGIREGDPDAVVGGPALAVGDFPGRAQAFMDYVKAYNLPLDFFSFHHYWSNENYAHELGAVHAALESDPRFRTVPVHINELNWSGGWIGEGSINNGYSITPHIFDIIGAVLGSTDVVQASWAQFMESTYQDDAYGIIYRDGRLKAAYNAFRIYADMPEERKHVFGVPEGIGLMASAYGGKAVVVAWNRGDVSRPLTLDFTGIPFARGRLRVYRIDQNNASAGNGAYEGLRAVETGNLGDTFGANWTGTLPGKGVAYLVWDDGTMEPFQEDKLRFPPAQRPGRFLRTHHWFPDRNASTYAWFDRKSWVARLGMGDRKTGEALVAVRADSLSDRISIGLTEEGGSDPLSANSALALRIDYEGIAPASVLLHWGRPPADAAAGLAWGTCRAADRTVRLDSAHTNIFDLKAAAPPGWNGVVVISFLMRDAGAGSRAAVTLARTGGDTGVRERNVTRRSPAAATNLLDGRGRRVRPAYAGHAPQVWLVPPRRSEKP